VILSALPIWIVDITGSVLMIIFSFLSLLLVHELRSRDPNNVIWTYLLWVCSGLALFAVSRSAGHILKEALLLSGQSRVWSLIQPLSGAINTLSFVVVASVTLFFEQIWKVYRQISSDKQALRSAHSELLYLNQNLEKMVVERTRALTRSEHKYRRIFEDSKDMILITGNDGSIVDLNPAGHTMLRLEEGEAVGRGRRFQDFFMDQSHWESLTEAIRRQGSVSNFEVVLKNQDGTKTRSLISGSMVRNPDETTGTYNFLVKDIQERRLAEQQMAQADKLASIGQLSAGVAHEINNPLGIILGYTQLLLKDGDRGEGRYGDLKTIEKHARSCKSIVENLLNFSRKSEPEREKVHVHDIIEEVLDFMEQHANLEAPQIITDFDPTVPLMELDAKKLKQVFINLVMNAEYAVGQEGTIKITTRLNSGNNQLSIRISDTGHGIEEENLSRIFDPFFTTKPTGEGTGLGLSVSYGIIRNHGGDITVESELGKGSTFTVTLPVTTHDEGYFS
jgi:two-component system, NtrC family, sensor kinase